MRARMVYCPRCSRSYNLNVWLKKVDTDDPHQFRCQECGGRTE